MGQITIMPCHFVHLGGLLSGLRWGFDLFKAKKLQSAFDSSPKAHDAPFFVHLYLLTLINGRMGGFKPVLYLALPLIKVLLCFVKYGEVIKVKRG